MFFRCDPCLVVDLMVDGIPTPMKITENGDLTTINGDFM
jgi:hypothetical protein